MASGRQGRARIAALAVLFSVALSGSSMAAAAPRSPVEGEPKRSYGSIDVVMYQTSW
ncbi:MAG: hypothetical protein ACYC7L_09130 [Nitrospirota bacterium]